MTKTILITLLSLVTFHALAFDRVISTAPSVTNIIKALGKESLLVGVSPYCKTSKKIPVVGTGLAFYYERALSLKTDLVIIPRLANDDLEAKLKRMKITTLVVDHDSLSGVMNSVLSISKALKVEKKGKEIFDIMLNESKKRKRSDLNAIFVVSSDVANGKIKDLYLAGRKGLYGELLVLAGHVNAAKNFSPGYPKINVETLLELNPDIIFYLTSKEMPENFEAALANLSEIKAVKNKKIIPISGDEFGVPDQHISHLVEVLAGAQK